ncbi:MAG: glycosyltransferase [Burkholderiaceae bacterium]
MLGVVVPAHDEEALIGACLGSLFHASRSPRLHGEPVVIVVALDACRDATESIANHQGAITVAVNSCNVGAARACGARQALKAGARWLAFTDADSVVAPDWLATQLDQHCDAVCGTIEVGDWGDWGEHGERVRQHHLANYTDADGHRHIHGANLGVTAQAYQKVGGFQSMVSSEDVALVSALHRIGASIAWSAAPRVVTSARRAYRAPGGFGERLARVEQGLKTHRSGSGAAR